MSSTATTTKIGGFDLGFIASLRRHAQAWALVGVVVLWIVLWYFMQGTDTLQISVATHTDVHNWLQDRADAIIAAQDNWFLNILHWIS